MGEETRRDADRLEFSNVSLGGCRQPGERRRPGGDWGGVRSAALGVPGASALSRSPRRPSSSCGLRRPGRRGRGRAGGVSPVPPPPRPPPPTRCSLSCASPPSSAARSRESNYFFHPRGAAHTRRAPEGEARGRAAAHFPPPEAEAGPLGRGERGLGGARGAADGTICPSARGPAGPRREAPGAAAGTPASAGMSGRRLARGCPAHARTRVPGSQPRGRPESCGLFFFFFSLGAAL